MKRSLRGKDVQTPRANPLNVPPSTTRPAFHLVLARKGASAPLILDETQSRSIRSGEVLHGREENCLLMRTHETRKGIHSEVLHRVLYPNAHGNGIFLKKVLKDLAQISLLIRVDFAIHSHLWITRLHNRLLWSTLCLLGVFWTKLRAPRS